MIRPARGADRSRISYSSVPSGLTVLTLVALRRPAPVFLGPVLLLGVVLFAVGGLLSSFDAESAVESATVVARVVYITVVWFWLGGSSSTAPATSRWRSAAGWPPRRSGAPARSSRRSSVTSSRAGDVHYGRVSGFIYQVNDLGGLCAVAAVPAAMLVTRGPRRCSAGSLHGALLLIVAGLLLSNSVTAMVAVVVRGRGVDRRSAGRPRLLVPVAAAVLLLSAFAAGQQPLLGISARALRDLQLQIGHLRSHLFTARRLLRGRLGDDPGLAAGRGRARTLRRQHHHGSGVHNMFLAAWYQAGLSRPVGS